jgi:GNAT superfamily N-acetyltransferase
MSGTAGQPSGERTASRGARRQFRLVDITDEREPLAERAFDLIHGMFAPADRQPVAELMSELAERRLGLLSSHNFHLIAAVGARDDDPPGEPVGAIIGVYLGGVNAGLVMYLAVREEHRGRRLGRLLRPRLVEAFREDARAAGHDDVAFVMGEVRVNSPWLRRLVRTRGAIPFDFDYFHPGMSPGVGDRYVLYREPKGDTRTDLSVRFTRRLLYAIYRRAYRVRYPLQREGFMAMLRQLEGRSTVGVHPRFRTLLAAGSERAAVRDRAGSGTETNSR